MTDLTPHSPQPFVLPKRPRRWRAMLLSLVIFLAGAVVGSALTVIVVAHRIQHAIRHPEEAPARIAKDLKKRLVLSDDQQQHVQAILAERLADLQTLRIQLQPQINAQLDLAFRQISEVLTPEQAQKWRMISHDYGREWLSPAPFPPATRPATRP